MTEGGTHIGLTGLAVMGANLARNVARHDIPIAVHNRTDSKTERFMAEHGHEGPITGTGSVEELVAALDRPRTIMVMVKAGAPVDAVIEELAPHLDEGDPSSTAETPTSVTPSAGPPPSPTRGAVPRRRRVRW